MFQIRIHGRGGQGVVTAAELISVAAFLEGRYAQAFPSFGSERMGAPVLSFCRINEKPIRVREPVLEPDALIIQDPTLLHQPGTFAGLATDGFVIINSKQDASATVPSGIPPEHCLVIPATELAIQYIGRPLPNAALLGAFAYLTNVFRLESLVAAFRERFAGTVGEANAAAAQAAWEYAKQVAKLRKDKSALAEGKEIHAAAG